MQAKHYYEFGPYRLNPAEHELSRGDVRMPLAPKAFETLLVLVKNNGRLVSKDKLMREVWPDSFVEESNLEGYISKLRKVLGEAQSDRQFIETVPKLGYRFVASVREVPDSADLIVEEHSRMRLVAEEEETDQKNKSEVPGPISEIKFTKSNPRAAIGIIEEPAARPSLGAEHPIGKMRLGRRGVVTFLVVLVMAVAGIAVALYQFFPWSKPPAPFQKMKMTRLTTTGKVTLAAVSPDGRYVLHVKDDAGIQSLWMRQVSTSSDVQIVPPSRDVQYRGLTFSHNGDHIYYVRTEGNREAGLLYEVPALGGLSRKLIDDVDTTSVALSPDGNQVAFVRYYPSNGDCVLMVAKTDGTAEQKIATRRFPYSFDNPAWSPDGKIIACAAENFEVEGFYENVIEIRVNDGAEKPITTQKWDSVDQVAWLADGSGLVMSAGERGGPSQLWWLPYPGGEARRITNDLDSYSGVNLARDSNALVTVRSEQLAHIWIGTDVDVGHSRQITSGTDKNDGASGVSWTPNGKVVYASNIGGSRDLWIIDQDGSHASQLTANSGANYFPSVSADGRFIAFISDRTGNPSGNRYSVWRMDIDGGRPWRLADGTSTPQWSPDGQWVVYVSWSLGKPTIWKVPAGGGEPQQLTDKYSYRPAISPDGRLVACFYTDEVVKSSRIAVVPFEGGQPVKLFNIQATVQLSRMLSWSPDGRALTYIDTRDGVSNIWRQPLDGSPPKQVTDFKTDQIFFYDWSPDGQRLALARGAQSSDVVLITDIR